ncbi:hypothetical protein [Microbacterium sp. CH12i]|uniref:hypothetical protein n=1 Tax=Microbacterium sp. CH12i TaxID=1479651 RepID=UPI0012682797|nr:hypothetical protein [Microbacterium sp. CH12i]
MSELENLRGQRQVVAAMLVAANNYQMVMRICASTTGEIEDVTRSLMKELDISDFEAKVILDMQMKKFSPASIAGVRAELIEIDLKIENFKL